MQSGWRIAVFRQQIPHSLRAEERTKWEQGLSCTGPGNLVFRVSEWKQTFWANSNIVS